MITTSDEIRLKKKEFLPARLTNNLTHLKKDSLI